MNLAPGQPGPGVPGACDVHHRMPGDHHAEPVWRAPPARAADARRAPARGRPVPRTAHRPGTRLSGLLRGGARRMDRDRSCATPTGTRCAPTAARTAGCTAQQLRDHASPRPACRRPFATPRSTTTWRGGCRWALPGASSSPSRCSRCGPATGCRRRCSVEGTLGQVQGMFSGTDIWHLNLMAEPLVGPAACRRSSRIGVGSFKNLPNPSAGRCAAHQRQAVQRRARRALLPDRPLHPARRLHALHRVRRRHAHRRVPGLDHRPGLLLLIA